VVGKLRSYVNWWSARGFIEGVVVVVNESVLVKYILRGGWDPHPVWGCCAELYRMRKVLNLDIALNCIKRFATGLRAVLQGG